MLIGHGGFGAFQGKQMLVDHWSALGINANVEMIRMIGWGEIAAGFLIFFAPLKPIILAILYWKIFTEMLYPIAGSFVDTWEWVERGGDYMAPVALIAALVLLKKTQTEESKAPVGGGAAVPS